MHGPGTDSLSFGGIRRRARKNATTPADGGGEKTYLHAFLDARVWAMRQEGNLDLDTPLKWKVYGDSYQIPESPSPLIP